MEKGRERQTSRWAGPDPWRAVLYFEIGKKICLKVLFLIAERKIYGKVSESVVINKFQIIKTSEKQKETRVNSCEIKPES